MDAMGMGLCVAFIAFVRLPSLKVSTLLLSGDYIMNIVKNNGFLLPAKN